MSLAPLLLWSANSQTPRPAQWAQSQLCVVPRPAGVGSAWGSFGQAGFSASATAISDYVRVTAIWMEQPNGAWSLQQTARYENEQALHDMVMSTPDLLPLSGSPQLTVIGREVALPSSGYADVIAVEPDGRPVIIEVKLRNNAESRRAVIAQTLSYAASLHGISQVTFEEAILGKHLTGQSLFDRVRESTQDATLIQSEFDGSLQAHLTAGSFRAVIVLDEAPQELINLMGFLEAVTTGMSFDLIAVKSYTIGDHRIAVPQRLDPERRVDAAAPASIRPSRRSSGGHLEPGVQPFRDLIDDTPDEYRAELKLMADWTDALTAAHPSIAAATYFGAADVSLLPRFQDENVGLVSFFRYQGGRPGIQFWRSVFERRAPDAIQPIEALIGKTIGRGTAANQVTTDLLSLIESAYVAGLAVGRSG